MWACAAALVLRTRSLDAGIEFSLRACHAEEHGSRTWLAPRKPRPLPPDRPARAIGHRSAGPDQPKPLRRRGDESAPRTLCVRPRFTTILSQGACEFGSFAARPVRTRHRSVDSIKARKATCEGDARGSGWQDTGARPNPDPPDRSIAGLGGFPRHRSGRDTPAYASYLAGGRPRCSTHTEAYRTPSRLAGVRSDPSRPSGKTRARASSQRNRIKAVSAAMHE